MGDNIYNISLPEVKTEINTAIAECNKRGLLQCAKWLAELNHGLSHIANDDLRQNIFLDHITSKDQDNYYLAKTYFDTREYDRAAYFTKHCSSPLSTFLYYYSKYMAKEKKRLEMINSSNLNDTKNAGLTDLDLYSVLKCQYSFDKLDGYCLYLYGILLKSLNLNEQAIVVLSQSIDDTPMLWSAWYELSTLVTDKEELLNLNLPNHWMKHIFLGHVYVELGLNDEGLKQFEDLQNAGFDKCSYIISRVAMAYHNTGEYEKAIELYQILQESDPYLLDNFESTMSDVLPVNEIEAVFPVEEVNTPKECCEIEYDPVKSSSEGRINPIDFGSGQRKKKPGDHWSVEETHWMINRYNKHVVNVGPNLKFHQKKHMWEAMSEELLKELGIRKSAVQITNKYKGLMRAKREQSTNILEKEAKAAIASFIPVVPRPSGYLPKKPLPTISLKKNVKQEYIQEQEEDEEEEEESDISEQPPPIKQPRVQPTKDVGQILNATLFRLDDVRKHREEEREKKREKKREERHKETMNIIKGLLKN